VQVNDSTGASKSYTTYIYDAGVNTHGSVTKVSRSTSGTTAGPFLSQQYSYNSDGTLATATDPNGTVTNYGYAGISCNNAFPTSIAVLGMTTTYAYNCTGGVVISAQDPNNATITTNYSDPFFWRPASTTDPLNNTTYFNYYGVSNSGTSAVTNVGQTESVMTFNGGNSTTDLLTTPDGYGRPVLQQTRQGPGSSNWDTVQTAYDGAARVQFVTAPYVSTAGAAQGPEPAEYWTYDGLNRVIDEKNYWYSIDINYSYNLNDVQVTVGPAPSGENTKRRQFEYDGLRRLTSVCELTSASGSSCGQNTNGVTSAYRTAYTYDAVGNLMGVNQSGQTRSFSYDGLGRMLSETNPETSANGTGATLNYYYDYESTCGRATGDKVKRVDPANNVTCYGYDGLHRLTQVSYPSGANAAGTATKTYIYDNASPWGVNVANPMGRLTGALTTINGTTTTAMFFSYDGRGQILENWNVAVAGGNIWSAVTQSYYSNGALASIQGNGGHQFNFTIDGEGRPFAMTDVTAGNTPWSSTLYNVASQPTSVSLLSGSESFTYDQTTGHMTGWQSAAGSTTQTGALTWNTNGTVQQLAVSGQPPCSYTYDDLARLSSANCGTTWTQNFGYDAFGNITKTVPTGSSGASFAAIYGSGNHVTNFGESYDAMGNTTKDNLGNSYSYDAEGRPLSLPGVTQVYYDAFNRAMTINRSGTYTNYLFTAAGQRYATMTGGTWQKYFLPLPAGMQAVYTPSGLQYYRHADWLGSSRFASTPSGAVQYSLGYAPFGETYSESGTVDRVYTGQTQDTVAGSTALYDFQFRQHASSQGRWLVPDPAGLAAVDPTNPQTWNRYAYVGNNPLNQVDAKGLCSWDETCPMIQESNGGFGGGGGLTPSAIASAWWNATFSAANSSISMAAWEEASLRLTMGDNYYMLPGKGNPQAQEEARHEAIITYGWDPTWDLQQKYSWAQGVISGNLTTFNGYTVNNNVAMCTAWAESSFDPRASNVSGPSDTGAWGLFQTRQIALTDFNKHFGTQYTLSDVHNSADISAYVGTGYLSLAIGTYHGGDVTIGLTAAGPGGSSYAKGIGNCASSLDAGNGVSAFK
jgi:RHS repeat-associated protein